MTLTPAPSNAEAAAALSRKLQDPETLAALGSLLDHAELLALLVEGLDDFIARSDVIGDSLVAGLAEVRESVNNNPDIAEAGVDLPKLINTAGKLARSDLVDTAARMAEADFAGPEAVDQIGVLARGLVRGGHDFDSRPTEVRGLLGAARLLKDPDISRALSYFATVAKAIGRELAESRPVPPSTSPTATS